MHVNVCRYTSNNSARRVLAPTAGFIYGYMRVLFELLKLEADCCVYAAVYIERLLGSTVDARLKVRPNNWMKILVGTLLIASKFHDDVSMKNRDFASALNGCSMARFNQLEAKLLVMLDWQIHVTIAEYSRKYAQLAQKREQSFSWDLNADMIKPYFSVCARHLVDDVLKTKNM